MIRWSQALSTGYTAWAVVALCTSCASGPQSEIEESTPTGHRLILTETANPRAAVSSAVPTAHPAQTMQPAIDAFAIIGDLLPSASWTKDEVSYAYYAVSAQTGIEYQCDLYLRVTDKDSDSIQWQVTEHAACWDFDWATLAPSERDREAFRLKRNVSDLNRNGWPEYSVILAESCGACDDANSGRVAHFEFGPDGQVVDIVPRGAVLVQFLATGEYLMPYGLAYGSDPDLLIATTLMQYDLHRYVEVPGLVQWSGIGFVDTSARHPEAIQGWIEDAKAQIRQSYDQPMTEAASEPLWRLLGLLNQSHMAPSEARDVFLGVSRLEQWPGTAKHVACWIQINRAAVQAKAEAGEPFDVYPLESLINSTAWDPTLAHVEIDVERYDVSACQS